MAESSAPLIVIGVTLAGRRPSTKVLVVQRRRSESELSWQFPGGAIEPGESEQSAAERETREETGILTEATERLGERVHPATGRRIAYWQLEYVSGLPTLGDLDDLQAVKWVRASELGSLFTTDIFPSVADALTQRQAQTT